MPVNRFLDKEKQEKHLRCIESKAGKRYSPELNVNLPILKIFDSLARTENFYSEIHVHYKSLQNILYKIECHYSNQNLEEEYKKFHSIISKLANLLKEINNYNTDKIPIEEINKYATNALEESWDLSDKLEAENHGIQKRGGSTHNQQFIKDHFPKLEEELDYFIKISGPANYSVQTCSLQLSNSQFLLITGEAGIGKTHLLCDLVKRKASYKKPHPAILAFAESFNGDDDPFLQIIEHSDLKIDKDKFLQLLNNAGKISRSRAIVAIDALNETIHGEYWSKHLGNMVREIEKYPNVALIISVRSGFVDSTLGDVVNKFIQMEHGGFQFKEFEAMRTFFAHYEIPLPQTPPLRKEFQNPLFLRLICEVSRKEAEKNPSSLKSIFSGQKGANHIFERFIKIKSEKIANKFNLKHASSTDKNIIWKTIIKPMAEEMVKIATDQLPEEIVIKIIKDTHKKVNCKKLIKELRDNLLLHDIPNTQNGTSNISKISYKFPFQKLSNHIIARYVFEQRKKQSDSLTKHSNTDISFFEENSDIGKFITSPSGIGILEALLTDSPERFKGLELLEVIPYIKKYPQTKNAFLESLVWRKGTKFRKEVIAYIDENFRIDGFYDEDILRVILNLSSMRGHHMNADFLHEYLCKFSMPERDSSWSAFLHGKHPRFPHRQHKGGEMIDKLISWRSSNNTQIPSEDIRLRCIVLCWFLTTSNRPLRDDATEYLVELLSGRLNVALELLKLFNTVCDPYISERLYAVVYGCAIRSKNNQQDLKVLAEWVYAEIFKDGCPPIHILIRDYARGIIEVALNRGAPMRIDRNKIKPPYNSSWPAEVPTTESLREEYGQNEYSQIWNSVMSHCEPGTVRDFGCYKIGPAVREWLSERLDKPQKESVQDNSPPKNMQNSSFDVRLAERWLFNQVVKLRWSEKLHGEFDRSIHRSSHDAGDKPERIGKKYQWIAFYELLARIADNFKFKLEEYSIDESTDGDIYEGPWNLCVRDIDPTHILNKFTKLKFDDEPPFINAGAYETYSPKNLSKSKSTWRKDSTDLPNPKKIIEITDGEGGTWLTLERNIYWDAEIPPGNEFTEYPQSWLQYQVRAYFVHSKNQDALFNWVQNEKSRDYRLPEPSGDFTGMHLGEYPGVPAFFGLHKSGYSSDEWSKEVAESEIPKKFLKTSNYYSDDYSKYSTLNIHLPTKFVVDGMALRQTDVDGKFFDKNGTLIAFDPGVLRDNIPSCLLIEKDSLLDFLKQKDCAILWIIGGEKRVSNMPEIEYPRSQLEIDGSYTFDAKGVLCGKTSSYFNPDLMEELAQNAPIPNLDIDNLLLQHRPK